MTEYITLPEPSVAYGPVRVYKMIGEGKKLPPDIPPEKMIRGVHYRLKIIPVETLQEMSRQNAQRRQELERHPSDGSKSKGSA